MKKIKKFFKTKFHRIPYILSIIFSLITTINFFSTHIIGQILYSIGSAVIYYISVILNEDKEKTKKDKILKKTALALTIATNITNLTINFDVYSQPIYGRYVLQKNPFGKEKKFEKETMTANEDKNINELCSEILMKSLNTNPYLKDKEKQILKPIKQFFLDNQFLNYEETYYNLNTFSIHNSILTKISGHIYNYKNDQDNDVVNAITVESNLKNINMKNIDIFEKEEQDCTYGHELFHVIGGFSNPFLNEGMASLLTKEYFLLYERNTDAYFIQRKLTKILIEMIGADTMLDAYSNHNTELIKKNLNKINNNPELTDELFNYLDSVSYNPTIENVKVIVDYLSPYIENLDENTRYNITNYISNIYNYVEDNSYIEDNSIFYYNSNLKNRKTNPIILNINKVYKKAS